MLVGWTGAVAFAAALLYLVYFYLVVLGDPAGPVDRRVPHAMADIGLFAIFALHHSLFARAAVKRHVTRLVPAAFERTAYVWIASALLLLVGLLWQPVAGTVYAVEGASRLWFWALQCAGVLLVLGAGRAVDARELAGIHQAAGQSSHGPLRIVGPFRVVRHPIYLGWFVMVWATPELTANRALFAAISSLYLILAIPWEERSLVADHGDQYRAYQRTVRWRLLPGLW